MREGVVCDEVREVEALGRLGAEELAARGHVEEEVADADGRAAWARGGRDIAHPPAFDEDARAFGFVFRLRHKLDARDRGDGGERLAAKAERVDAREVFRRADLR